LKQAYIDFEIAEGEFEDARALYERLLDRTKHLKVWIRYAKFEASAMEHSGDADKRGDEIQGFLQEKKLCYSVLDVCF